MLLLETKAEFEMSLRDLFTHVHPAAKQTFLEALADYMYLNVLPTDKELVAWLHLFCQNDKNILGTLINFDKDFWDQE